MVLEAALQKIAPTTGLRVYCCGNFLGLWGPPPAAWFCRKCKTLIDSRTAAAL